MHRLSGSVLAVFVLVHVLQHLAVLAGAGSHLALMEALRTIYRWPPVEALLLLCVAIQLMTGLPLAWAARAPAQRWARFSGLYLLVFLGIHTGAVLVARTGGIDTNIYFAAAGMHAWPAAAFFYPYYFFAVVAVTIHMGSALARRQPLPRKRRFIWRCAGAGVLLSALILAGMARIDIPAPYLQPFVAAPFSAKLSSGTSG
ncbi:hypothetical protein [Pseudoduganella chitinolytica]|uniref:Uncharacterized protein n=1 Tax=Pseudoduganella chitinolytica TaxID=34070 RepID=A0ABY8B7U3_9BURK|nr:hypothetical protein [Pseudoduganella chitinolytica]WEF31870.1 hypothetical protein PX653_20905 [Pseudoduganella chitinolytica]